MNENKNNKADEGLTEQQLNAPEFDRLAVDVLNDMEYTINRMVEGKCKMRSADKTKKKKPKTPKGKYLCRICREYKNKKGFHKRKLEKNGIAKICKICTNKRVREIYVTNKSKKMSPRVETLRKLYTKRIAAIKKAGMSINESGISRRIDRLLKRSGLYNG